MSKKNKDDNKVKKPVKGKTKLKRELGFTDITLATAGYIIGAGIYAVIGLAAGYAKDFTWLSVVICGIIAICTGMSFSELASMFNKNAGEYYYTKEAFNDGIAKVVAYFIIITEILTINAISFGLGNYLSTFINVKPIIISACSLIIFGYLNYVGIRESMDYNNIATIIEISGLILISILGFKNIKSESFDLSKLKMDNISPILIGTALIYFAYFGYDIVIELSEETKEPEKNIPKGMLYGLGISTILYCIVTISSISTIGWKNLSESKAPMIDVANALLGGYGGKLLLLIAVISMSNTLLLGHVASSRFIQSTSKNINIPFNMDKIDDKTQTPKNAIIAVTLISLIGLLLGNLERSVSITNIGTLFIFLLVNVSVIILRKKYPNAKRPFTIPFAINNIPISSIVGGLSSIVLAYYLINNLISG